MKKNNALMRASGILLVLTLGTSCFVGGTFAKYVTEADATDTARVAKWGVEVKVTGDAFNTYYGKDDVSTALPDYDSTTEGTQEYSVYSSKEDKKVVAPGTYGTFGGIEITGQPEVAVKVSTDATFDLGENWVVDGEFYCPIVVQVGDEQFCGLNYDNAAGFENAVEGAIDKAISGVYNPNTNLEGAGTLQTEIKWRWAFDNENLESEPSGSFTFDSAIKDVLASQDDEKDTALGDKAADDNASAPTISLTVDTTVTQID